jgi:triacylglycerol lipase
MKKQANCLRCLKYQEIGAKRHSQITGSLPRPANGGRAEIGQAVGLEERFSCPIGATSCSLYYSTGAFPSDHSIAILVFKGTSSLRQWMSNIDTLPVSWEPCGHVHGGFAKAFAGAWDTLGPRLEALKVPLFISGHSLGGALATLATARLSRPPIATYTFGSPRVGNQTFAEQCLQGAALYRVVNHLDMICSVPRPVSVSRRLRFAHAGETVRFDGNGARLQGEGALNDSAEPSIRRLFKDAFQSTRPPRALADHAILLYVDRLRRLVDSAT